VTLEHLLTMTAGFDWNEWDLPYSNPQNSLREMFRSGDAVQYVLDLPMAYDPGEKWVYNSGVSILLGAIIEQSTANSMLSFARKYLFDPLGISDIRWSLVSGGYYDTGGGLSLRLPDMMKLGYLYLTNGTWDNKELLYSDWIKKATQTLNYPFENEQYSGYGYQWWTIPSLGVFCGRGAYGQTLFVAPEHELLVGFNAYIPEFPPILGDTLFTEYILPALEMNESENDPTLYYILIVVILLVPSISLVIYLKIIKKKKSNI
jgi:CubicO group peptidase (beta-lactamase class C family)